MRGEVPARARELAARLAALFVLDSRLAERLNDAQRRLQYANDQLWSGLHPDALGVVYDDAHPVAVGHGESAIAGRMLDALAGDGRRGLETAVLGALQRAHWTIHSAFVDYQSACEERRRLAVDVGELSQQLTVELCAAGWSEDAARSADVHELAAAAAAAAGAWEQGR
jgi:hypothetical protein